MLAYYCIGTTNFPNTDCLSLPTMLEPSILLLTLSGIRRRHLISDEFFRVAAIINFALKSQERKAKKPGIPNSARTER